MQRHSSGSLSSYPCVQLVLRRRYLYDIWTAAVRQRHDGTVTTASMAAMAAGSIWRVPPGYQTRGFSGTLMYMDRRPLETLLSLSPRKVHRTTPSPAGPVPAERSSSRSSAAIRESGARAHSHGPPPQRLCSNRPTASPVDREGGESHRSSKPSSTMAS